MSEQHILNESPFSPLNPDWPFGGEPAEQRTVFRPRNGPTFSRVLGPSPHVFDLVWSERELWVANRIRQWEAAYRNAYFTLYDYERNRAYTGRFEGRPQIQGVSYNKWNIAARFVEIAGAPMKEYPSRWLGAESEDDYDSSFLEERDADGYDLVKLTGAGWTWSQSAAVHGGAHYWSVTLDDAAEWLYFGYGFRLWSLRRTDYGIVEISVDGAVLQNVDLYAAATINSSPVFIEGDLPLGSHRVKLRNTHTKNANSTNYAISADALEVME